VAVTAEVAQASSVWWRVTSSAGTTQLDPSLDGYRWDVSGSTRYGLQAEAGWGRWSAGLRGGRLSTRQSTGIAGDPRQLTARLTTFEATGRAKLADAAGFRLASEVHGGWLHLGYTPNHLDLDVLGDGSTVPVTFGSIDDWIVGVELAVERPLVSGLALGLHVDHSTFWLDTSHRNGTDIEERRESFGNWTVGAQLSWTWTRR
jgi:hypothetical protein